MKTQAISYDLRYFFTNKGVIKIDENLEKKFIRYNVKNLVYGIKMLQENIQIKFSRGLISMDEYLNSSKKFLYEMVTRMNTKGRINIIKEWHDKYSRNNLLTESVNEYQVIRNYNLGWYGVQNLYKERIYNMVLQENIFGDIWGGVKSLAKWGWESIKDTITKASNCAGKDSIDCFMEGVRTVATSLLGVTVLTAVSFVPFVGQIPNFVIFGALLIYDLWKMMTGKEYKVSDIVVNIVSLLAPYIAKGIGYLLKPVTSFFGLGKFIVSKAASGAMGKVIQIFTKGISGLTSIISKTVSFFAIKLGIKWFADMAQPATEGLTKIDNEIKAGMKSGEEEMKKEKESENDEMDDEEMDDEEMDDEEMDIDDESNNELNK